MSNFVLDKLDDLDTSRVSDEDVVIINGDIPTVGIVKIVQPLLVYQVMLSSVETVEGEKTHVVQEESFLILPTGDRIKLPNFGKKKCMELVDGQDKRATHVAKYCDIKEEKDLYISEEQGLFQYLVIPYPSGNERIILAVESHINRRTKMWALIYRVYLAHKCGSTWEVRRLVRNSAPLFECILDTLGNYLGKDNPLSTLIETHKKLSHYPPSTCDMTNVLGSVRVYHPHIKDLFDPIAVIDGVRYCATSLATSHKTRMMRVIYTDFTTEIPFDPDSLDWQQCHEYLLTNGMSGVHPISGSIVHMGHPVEDGLDTVRVSNGLGHKGLWFVFREGFFVPTLFLQDRREIEEYMRKELKLVETLKNI